MARTNDFAFLFVGGENNQILPFDLNQNGNQLGKGSRVLDTAAYEQAKKSKNSTRTLTSVGTGSDGDIDGNVAQLIKLINDKAGNKLDTIGAVCIVGSSNGASLALALAAKLTALGVPQLMYVGVTDVTIQPAGRSPVISGIGDLMPIREPTFTTIANKARSGQGFTPGVDNPHMDVEPPPVIRIDSTINSKFRRNFYQKQGNHVRLVKSRPRGLGFGWWWTSTMFPPKFGEVHGEIEGFEQNKPFVVTGPSDFEMHNAICEGQPFKDMIAEASAELANFPV